MSQDRLTRPELSWLLAQEARGAARALRQKVAVTLGPAPEGAPASAPVETTLDALDDAIEMLSELNTRTRAPTSRRGRIDVASLIYDIAPGARIAIEPGAGTEVFGDEAELRRMLGVLLSGPSGPRQGMDVRIRRRDSWIQVEVELGLEAGRGQLERRWLSRTATRHGGWFELDGGAERVYLKADASGERSELVELKRELAEAQELGEAYARELAGMLATDELESAPPSTELRNDSGRFEGLRAAAAALERTLRSFADSLRKAATEAGDPAALAQALGKRAAALSRLASELALVADARSDEAPAETELSALLEAAVAKLPPQQSVLEIDVPAGLVVRAPRGLVELLLTMLLAQAQAATPRDAAVCVRGRRTDQGISVVFRDGGPPVPATLREAALLHEVEPTSLGRPAGFSLVAAHATAALLRASLELEQGADGAAETRLLLRDR